jgi:hypothetical protein
MASKLADTPSSGWRRAALTDLNVAIFLRIESDTLMGSKCWLGIAALGLVVGLGGPTMAEDQVATGAAFMKAGSSAST